MLAASDLETADRRLTTIPGNVPPAGQFPSGCVFRTRCRYATDVCATTPSWSGTEAAGFACHHPAGNAHDPAPTTQRAAGDDSTDPASATQRPARDDSAEPASATQRPAREDSADRASATQRPAGDDSADRASATQRPAGDAHA
ncbi:MAG TPA: oligopeptide/dipeptide ABC transporter ATP-binding protein [Kribbella sp.]|nr:oligopeptide/dipeptide ABC transporter ATP-binding protein [Kribbella sp.]